MTQETITILRINGDPAALTIEQLKKNIQELKDELSKLTIGTDRYQKTLTSLIANQNALRGAMNGTSASLDNVADSATGTVKSYNGLVAKMAELNREYRSLDFNTEAGQKRMQELAVEINGINDELKKFDIARGNYGRMVGNYRTAINGLNNATAQVVRELPSLAISANTFFLAISNNIPILADQIANLRAQNEAAIAQGGKAVNVLTAVVKSFFSWNTILTLVLTVVTLFGDKIIEFVGNLFKGKEAVVDMTKALKDMEKAMDTASIGEQIANYQRLVDLYREIGDSAEEKRKFLEDYRDEIDKTGVSVQNIYDADKLFIYGTDDFIRAIQQRAMALAGMELAAEQYKKALEEQNKSSERRSKLEGMLPDAEYDAHVNKLLYGEDSSQAKQSQRLLDSIKKEIQKIDDCIAALRETGNKYIEAANDLNKEADKILNLEDEDGSGSSSSDKDNTLDYIRQMQDAQLALLDEGYERQLAERKLYYERQIEDLKNTLETEKNLTEEGRAAINETIRALTLQGEQESARIMEEWEQSKRDIAQETIDALIADSDELSRQLDKEEQENERRRERELEQTRKWAQGMRDAQLGRVDSETDHAVTMNRNDISMPEGWRAWKEYDIIQEANQKKLELMKSYEEEALKAGDLTAALDWQQQQADLSVAIEEEAAQRKEDIWEATQRQVAAFTGNVSGLLSTLADMYEEDAENNEKAAQQAKNLKVAAATIDTIGGAVTAYMQAQSLGPIAGPIVGAVQAALVLATGLAQIQKIKNTDVDKDKEPSGGISASVDAPTVTPRVTEVRNVTSASEEDRLNRMADDQRVYILSSDIEASQNRRRAVVKETSF